MINETESKHSLVLLLENIWECYCQIPEETYYVDLQSAFIIEDLLAQYVSVIWCFTMEFPDIVK